MMNKENKITFQKAFTLIELLIVIAIIGILSSVVLVSSRSGVDKAKTASAITTMSSLLPELVTCADDNGKAIRAAVPTGNSTTGTYVCCISTSSDACVPNTPAAGHFVRWPDINTKTGYTYQAPTNTLSAGTYIFTATKGASPDLSTITCSYATNECTEVKS
ncbi:MAG: Type iv secretion system prepilin [Parcubacteria group bacterium GW2011_GWD2_38_11]|nr:MAG: Type iv secretion system prepilin [Parcubacteria group bacterium GW2011_GWD2_38_11]